MPPTDISEKGLETLIMRYMTGVDGLAFGDDGAFSETPDAIAAQKAGGNGWIAGSSKDFDRSYAQDVPQLFQFLQSTQVEAFKKLGIADYRDAKDITRLKFLSRLPAGIAIDSLRTEVHLFLFDSLPNDPWQALQSLEDAKARYTGKVLGAENMQGNLEVKAHWRIERQPTPALRPVSSGVFRPTTPSDMQQVRADVVSSTVKGYNYLFERQKERWWPVFSDRDNLYQKDVVGEQFPIRDTPWHRESSEAWKLVIGLKQSEGPPEEKDAAALALAKPESGSFVLVSLRRRERGGKR